MLSYLIPEYFFMCGQPSCFETVEIFENIFYHKNNVESEINKTDTNYTAVEHTFDMYVSSFHICGCGNISKLFYHT